MRARNSSCNWSPCQAGPHIPPGTKLPDGFPYTFLGCFSSSWSTVAVLLAPEIAQAVELRNDVGNERRMWFTCRPVDGGPSWLLAAIYGPPGGDVQFWVQLLDEWVYLRRLLNIHATFIFGDLNIHLPYLVQHELTCHCLHCQPSIVDREIHQMLERAGVKCCNPVGVPTHQSGTTIDGFLTGLGHGLPPVAVLPPGTLAGSDHRLVSSALPLYVSPHFHTGFGRVWWASNAEWDLVLQSIDDFLSTLASFIEQLMTDQSLQQWANQQLFIKRQRAIVNTCFWLRDAWYTICGNLAGAVGTSRPAAVHRVAATPINALHQGGGEGVQRFRQTVEQAEWAHWRKAVSRYFWLHDTDRGQADRFMSKLLAPKSAFSISLCAPSGGEPLTVCDSLGELQASIESKAISVGMRDPTYTASVTQKLRHIRRQRVRQDDPPAPLFTFHALDLALRRQHRGSAWVLCGYQGPLQWRETPHPCTCQPLPCVWIVCSVWDHS